MNKILNPRNDAVFYMYFVDANNQGLLKNLLEAILKPKSPIETVTLLNPNLDKALISEKGVELDLALELQDGTVIDVELQVRPTEAFRKRILYYWSKLHTTQLKVGNSYAVLPRTVSICFLDYNEFQEAAPDEMHSVFEIRERTRGTLYTEDLELHFIELKKLEPWLKSHGPQEQGLAHWMQFLKITELSDSEVSELRKDPIMSNAIESLKTLSQSPEAQALADARERARINFALNMSSAHAKGLIEGRQALLRQAHASGTSIEDLAKALNLSISEVRELIEED